VDAGSANDGVLGLLTGKGGGGGRCGGARTCTTSDGCQTPDFFYAGLLNDYRLAVNIDIEAPSAADVEITTVGHVWVAFGDPEGRFWTFGFYSRPGELPDPVFHREVTGCVVHPDMNHLPCVDYSKVFILDKASYDQALEFAKTWCVGVPKYHLTDRNCTTFARLVVEAAGRSLPPTKGPVGPPPGIMAENPNKLLDGLKGGGTAPAPSTKPTTDEAAATE
jgi:hypothetical protein